MKPRKDYLITVKRTPGGYVSVPFRGTWRQALQRAYGMVDEGATETRAPLIEKETYGSMGFFDDDRNEYTWVTIEIKPDTPVKG